jgi:hypothetical protein
MITDDIFYFQDWNNGLGKKYLVTRGPSTPVLNDEGKITGYMDAPEKFTEVNRNYDNTQRQAEVRQADEQGGDVA